MTREKRIKIDMFPCFVHVIVTDDMNKCVDDKRLRLYCSESPDEDLSKDCKGLVFQKGKTDYYVVLMPDATCGAIAHESVHLIGRIFRDRGQEADYGNDEVFAYFVGWMTWEISGFMDCIK